MDYKQKRIIKLICSIIKSKGPLLLRQITFTTGRVFVGVGHRLNSKTLLLTSREWCVYLDAYQNHSCLINKMPQLAF